jgi:thioredoxin 1
MKEKNALEKMEVQLKRGQLQILDFWAIKCTPCELLGYFIDELHEKHGDAFQLNKINAHENEDLRIKYRVMNVPTLIFLKDGDVVFRHVGFDGVNQTKQEIEREIIKHLSE